MDYKAIAAEMRQQVEKPYPQMEVHKAILNTVIYAFIDALDALAEKQAPTNV